MKEITVKDVVVELQKRFLGEFTVYLYSMPNEEKDFVDTILLAKKSEVYLKDRVFDGEMHIKGLVINPNFGDLRNSFFSLGEIMDVLEKSIREKLYDKENFIKENLLVDCTLDANYVLENTQIRLIELEGNEELLSYVANYPIPDLGLAAMFAVCINDETFDTVLLTELDRRFLGITLEDLYDTTNSAEEFEGYSYKSLMDYLNIPHEVREIPFIFSLPEQADEMGVIQKEKAPFSYGTSAMLHTDFLYDVAEQIGDSFYMVPTSLCELVCVPEKMVEDSQNGIEGFLIPEDMEVSPDMVLCNHVFKYDRDEGDVSLVL